jgi:hypothetical protein
MAEYFRVGPPIWNKPRTDDQRLMAFYLLTNSHRITEGLYRLPLSFAVEDMGWEPARVREAVADLEAEDFANYDHHAKVVLIVKALAWQPPENPNVAKAAVRRVLAVPDSFLRSRFIDLAEKYSPQLSKALHEQAPEWVSESRRKPFPNGFPTDISEPRRNSHLISSQLTSTPGGVPE